MAVFKSALSVDGNKLVNFGRGRERKGITKIASTAGVLLTRNMKPCFMKEQTKNENSSFTTTATSSDTAALTSSTKSTGFKSVKDSIIVVDINDVLCEETSDKKTGQESDLYCDELQVQETNNNDGVLTTVSTVTFNDSLSIRHYETILGDNPSPAAGAPLSIGWRYYCENTKMPLNNNGGLSMELSNRLNANDDKTNNDEEIEKKPKTHLQNHQQKKTKIESIYLTEQRRIQRLKEFGVSDEEIKKRITEIKIVQHQRHVTASRPPPIFRQETSSMNQREKSPSTVKISTNKITFSGSGSRTLKVAPVKKSMISSASSAASSNICKHKLLFLRNIFKNTSRE